MTPNQLDVWETLCREATPAPWTGKHDIIWAHIDEEELPVQDRDTPVAMVSSCANDPCEEGFTPEQAARNRDFILAARDAMPALIQEVRRLQKLAACEWCGGTGKRVYRDTIGEADKCHNCSGTGQHTCEGKP